MNCAWSSRAYCAAMTYSVVALDEQTGALGVAVQSKVLAAGAGLAWAEAGVGAVATQAIINRDYGPGGLRLLREGSAVSDAIAQLTDADTLRAHRQVGIVTAAGGSAAFTGESCISWAGHRTAHGIAVQGNILAGAAVVDDLFEAATADRGPLPERLIGALMAAEAAGGDRRGRQAAALLVVPSTDQDPDSMIDLRVDDDDAPIPRLAALLRHHRLLMDRPDAADLAPMTPTLAADVRSLLEAIGYRPDRIGEFAIRELMEPTPGGELGDEAPVGEPRPLPDEWNASWQEALTAWMVLENLEARFAAAGWIDPQVVDFLRGRVQR